MRNKKGIAIVSGILLLIAVFVLLGQYHIQKREKEKAQALHQHAEIMNAPLTQDKQTTKEHNIELLRDINAFIKQNAETIADHCIYLGRFDYMPSTWIIEADWIWWSEPDQTDKERYLYIKTDDSAEYYFIVGNGSIPVVWKDEVGGDVIWAIIE